LTFPSGRGAAKAGNLSTCVHFGIRCNQLVLAGSIVSTTVDCGVSRGSRLAGSMTTNSTSRDAKAIGTFHGVSRFVKLSSRRVAVKRSR
jgi:hypothetical protein